MKLIKCLFAILSMMVFNMAAHAATAMEHQAAIASAMHQQWDRADKKLEILLIVLEGEVAIVDWILGNKGGRALLKYHAAQAQWQTFLCGGAALTDFKQLQHAGVALPAAQALTQALHVQEQALGPDQKALVDSFQGVIKFTQETHPHE